MYTTKTFKDINKNKDWILKENQAYIQSNLMINNNFKHAFFTRNNENSGPYKLINKLSKNSSLHQLNQIHGAKVINSEEALTNPWPEGDCLISSPSQNESLWIYTADCIPILFADKRTRRVAACHAGWKGITNKIINKVILKFESYGSQRADLIISLGPSIGPEKYQVSPNLLLYLFNSIESLKIIGKRYCRESKLKLIETIGIAEKDLKDNKFLLDLKKVVLLNLLSLSLKRDQISICNICTFSEKDLFFSWRRDQNRFRQWSCIISD